MTPKEWYDKKRKEYFARYDNQWQHLFMYGESQNSELCETAMRSGVECRALNAVGPDEIEMIANAIMIRDYIKARRNHHEERA